MSGPHNIEATLPLTSTQAAPSPESSSSEANHVEVEDSAKEWDSEHHYRGRNPTINYSTPSHGIEADHERRTQRARRSGGFLLQDATPTNKYNTMMRSLQHASDDPKGKARISDGVCMNPKRAPTRRHHQKTSIGSSPLSTMIYNDADRSGSLHYQSCKSDRTSLNHSEPRAQEQGHYNESTVSGQIPPGEGQYFDRRIPSAIGHDTDPARIVNLALNLSESRRRNISGNRLSPVYVNGTTRQVSTGSNSTGPQSRHASTTGTNLRRHLNDQRRISRSSAPRSGADFLDISSPRSALSSNGGELSFASEFHDPNTAEEVILKPSEATLARAEKARIAFELSYEYRRLLQCLPKLPSSAHGKQDPPKSANDSEKAASDALGRAYDPLQYIRNRKVRGRERQHLDAEAEGWKDVDRVRSWVNRMVNKYQAGNLSVDDKHRLPPLGSIQMDSQNGQGLLNPNGLTSISTRPAKSERQSSGWAFRPWDLLADAAWLDRNGNVGLIEDSQGKKLLPDQKVPSQSTPRRSLEQARPPSKRSLSLSRAMVQEEQRPVGVSSVKQRKRNLSHIRGKSNDVISPLKGNESPKERKGRWHRTFIRSRSPSSSESSLTDGTNGYAWNKHHDREGLDSVALEKQMMELLAKEIDDDPFLSKPTKTESVKQLPHERSADDERRQTTKTVSRAEAARTPVRNSQTDISAGSPLPESGRVEEKRGRRPRTSFDELDGMAPNSPTTFHFGPSIFINRSAPNSRSVSPKKPLASRLRARHSRSQSRQSMNSHGLAVTAGSPVRSAQQHTSDPDPRETNQAMQKSDSNTNLLSPITAELFKKRFHRVNNSSSSIRVGRDSKDSESRFKGLLKGTRIAELVGNEVNRVGDMIWKRDGSSLSRTSSPISARALGDSDTEGEYSTLENSPETDLSRATTNNEDGRTLSRMSTRSGQPKYHHQNLPTFRSSISGASPASPKTSSPEDHPITRQQMAQKARGRSSRFDRLAPPKIDMRSVSPSASPPLSPVQANDTSKASRNPSTSRPNHRVHSADRRLNDVLGIPGTVRNVVTPTGLTNLSSRTTPKHHHHNNNNDNGNSRPPLGDRNWSISSRSVSNTRGGTVTKRDIARVRALLLSSGIKANEIAHQANTIDDPPFLSQLRALHDRTEKLIPRVPRAQEHLLTAKLTVAEIDTTSQAIRNLAESFSSDVVETLHARFKELDERVSGTLVPDVRKTADFADSLSTELMTTHTLGVKRVGDAVEVLLRRRRRKGRWVRRWGWVVLEWILLGCMWMVWLVVVVVRLGRGVLRGFGGMVRWMVWL